MFYRKCDRRTVLTCLLASLALLIALAPRALHAQDDVDSSKPEEHGRKYKAPPQTSNIEVTVVKDFNKKPIVNAAVVFHPVKDGKDEGFLEMKTDPEGKAKIDVIPTGSSLRIQVLATGFATFAQDYQIEGAERKITISMLRPRAQVSTYVDETGKPSGIKPGVQEPVRPKKTTGTSGASSAATSSSTPSGSNPQ